MSRVVVTCHDILATIFDNLSPEGFDPGVPEEEQEAFRWHCRRSLAASALSCRSLSDHALNVLWRELDSVQPLLKVLLNYKRVDSGFKLCGPILPAHWTRFQLYADRVRVILGSPNFEDSIDPSIWPFLAIMCKGSPLMPCLRKLTVNDMYIPETSAFVLLLLSPTLRVVDITFDLEYEKEPEIVPLLHTLPLIAPNLEKLTFDIDGHGDLSNLEYGYLESFGLHFTRLKTLSIDRVVPLEGTVLQFLSSISTLKNLTWAFDYNRSSEPDVGRNTFTFQQLSSLDIKGRLDHLVTFFHACQFPSLVITRLGISGAPQTRSPEDSLAAICRSCNPASLTSFFVDIVYSGTMPRPSSLMQYSEPLLAFPNITSFRLQCYFVFPPVNDNELMRFGTAWPRLESFRVEVSCTHFPLPNVARPTLPGIIALAQRCPRLNIFHVSELDATVIPPKNEIPVAGYGIHRFKINNITPKLSSRRCMEAAAVIDRAFPDIDLEYASESNWYGVGPKWKEIVQFLEAMRLGREHCELRAKLQQAVR